MYAELTADYSRETHAPYTDCLTDLLNHGMFQMLFTQEVRRAVRYASEFSLALIDINSFDLYNKKHGSARGDLVLKELSQIIRDNIRESDIAARYSGDVFSLVIAESGKDKSMVVIDRIKCAIDKRFGDSLAVAISLVSFPADAANKEDLLQKAYSALCQAKSNGKNNVISFKQEPTSESKPHILVVDDEPLNVKLMEAFLHPLDCIITKGFSGEEALSLAFKRSVDLILLDAMMPGIDGFEVCRRLKANESTKRIPIVFVTALDDSDSKVRAIEAGADDFITKPPNAVELLARTKSLIKMKKNNDNLVGMENVLFSLANTIEAKDPYTRGHINRVSSLAVSIGHMKNLSFRELEALRIGGMLHDIGKIGVPDSILNKPGQLTGQEYEKIKKHPDLGYQIAEPLKMMLKEALTVIRHHHEKLDGSGYPDGLRGEEISTVARIMAVADIYDALVIGRTYHKAYPSHKAFEILREEADNGRLDRVIVDTLITIVSGEQQRALA
jgi:putative two-component system response regulator